MKCINDFCDRNIDPQYEEQECMHCKEKFAEIKEEQLRYDAQVEDQYDKEED